MNSVNLTGRLTRDPEIRYTDGGTSIARFSIAVDRKFTQENGPKADFPNCIAFGKTAEFIEKWFSKGMKIEVTGRIQTGSYKNQDGNTVYTTDVVAERVGFAESRASNSISNSSTKGENPAPGDDGFMDIPADIEDEMPF